MSNEQWTMDNEQQYFLHIVFKKKAVVRRRISYVGVLTKFYFVIQLHAAIIFFKIKLLMYCNYL